MKTKLEELKEAVASLQTQLESLKGDMKDGDPMQPFNNRLDMMTQQMRNMQSSMYSIADDMYARHNEHLKGHLPPVKSASQMKACLKALGMDGDYEVKKPVITVAKTRHGDVIEASYTKEA